MASMPATFDRCCLRPCILLTASEKRGPQPAKGRNASIAAPCSARDPERLLAAQAGVFAATGCKYAPFLHLSQIAGNMPS